MQAKMTAEMLEILRNTREIPDNLRAPVDAAREDGDRFLVELSEDEAMAMEEMCQWYVKKDPATGELTDRAKVYDGIIQALYDAQD